MAGQKNQLMTEDWWAVYLGLLVFVLGLGALAGMDLLGWVVKPSMFVDLGKSLAPASKAYAAMGGFASLVVTYIVLVVLFAIGARSMGWKTGKFVYGFTVIFWITYCCVIAGNYANIAANSPADIKKFGLSWSLRLTAESGLIICLLVGLFISNFLPKFADSLKEATRPEWYIKTAIVILGAGLGVKAVAAMGLATSVMFRGLCAIIEAYLIYWAVVYWMSRKWFGFSREWVCPPCLGDLYLRRFRGDRYGRRHPGASHRPGDGLLSRGDLCGRRAYHPAPSGASLSLQRASRRGCMDGPRGEDGRRSGRERPDRRFADPG